MATIDFHGYSKEDWNEGVHNVDSQDMFNAALTAHDPSLVVVDFFATWCGPCKVIAPKIAEFSKDKFPDVRFIKIDVDELTDVAQQQNIRAMPTFKFFKNGKAVAEVVGANPEAIKNAIEKHKD